MRPATALSSLLLLTAFVGGSALAQVPAEPTATPTSPEQAEALSRQEQQEQKADGRRNQRIERIRVEDGGSRVDEVRVGGQTQSITVKPKSAGGGIPEYEVQPSNGARDGGPSRSGSETITGPRVWKLRKF